MKNTVLLIVLSLAAGAVQAQTAGTITLRANSTSATGSMAPVLTWSTSPTATRCTASGGWSGTKAASGTQTLSSITASTNYTLTCTWGVGIGDGALDRSPPPTPMARALTNLTAYRVYYGTSSSSLSQVNEITDASASCSHDQRTDPSHLVFQGACGECQPGRIIRQQCLLQGRSPARARRRPSGSRSHQRPLRHAGRLQRLSTTLSATAPANGCWAACRHRTDRYALPHLLPPDQPLRSGDRLCEDLAHSASRYAGRALRVSVGASRGGMRGQICSTPPTEVTRS